MKALVAQVALISALVVLVSVAEPCESARVFIKALTGKTITLDNVDLVLDTILNIKSRIEDEGGIPAETLQLVFGGQQLDDDRTLADYGIPEGANIIMVLQAAHRRRSGHQPDVELDSTQHDETPDGTETRTKVAPAREEDNSPFNKQKAIELFQWLFGDNVDLHRLETGQPGDDDDKTAKLFFKAKPGYDVKVVREQLKSKLKWLFDLLSAPSSEAQSSQLAGVAES